MRDFKVGDTVRVPVAPDLRGVVIAHENGNYTIKWTTPGNQFNMSYTYDELHNDYFEGRRHFTFGPPFQVGDRVSFSGITNPFWQGTVSDVSDKDFTVTWDVTAGQPTNAFPFDEDRFVLASPLDPFDAWIIGLLHSANEAFEAEAQAALDEAEQAQAEAAYEQWLYEPEVSSWYEQEALQYEPEYYYPSYDDDPYYYERW